ncbi:MAG TPA: hypothetical protein VHG69_07950 [Thermoleophilaceae bacterium]|nr:hypothetical protein [Thermoleophilaceae bacterium]
MSARDQRSLPTHQDALSQDVCPGGPVEREEITVEELARTHLEGVEGVDTPCYLRLEARLRELRDG